MLEFFEGYFGVVAFGDSQLHDLARNQREITDSRLVVLHAHLIYEGVGGFVHFPISLGALLVFIILASYYDLQYRVQLQLQLHHLSFDALLIIFNFLLENKELLLVLNLRFLIFSIELGPAFLYLLMQLIRLLNQCINVESLKLNFLRKAWNQFQASFAVCFGFCVRILLQVELMLNLSLNLVKHNIQIIAHEPTLVQAFVRKDLIDAAQLCLGEIVGCRFKFICLESTLF